MIVVTLDNVDVRDISDRIEIHCMQSCGECHHTLDLVNKKCATRIWIPTRHLTTAKGDKVKAMELFLEEIT